MKRKFGSGVQKTYEEEEKESDKRTKVELKKLAARPPDSDAKTVYNVYDQLPKKYQKKPLQYPNFEQLKIELPCRIMICGKSGSMKTNLLMNLLRKIAAFPRIILCVKNPDQPLYQWFIDAIRKLELKLGCHILEVYTEVKDLPPVEQQDSRRCFLVVDDQINEKKIELENVSKWWSNGRAKDKSMAWIGQSYFGTPMMIRKNTDYTILKGVTSMKDFKRIAAEVLGDANQMEPLKRLFMKTLKDSPQDFFMIDQKTTDPHYRYRKSFEPLDEPIEEEDDLHTSMIKHKQKVAS